MRGIIRKQNTSSLFLNTIHIPSKHNKEPINFRNIFKWREITRYCDMISIWIFVENNQQDFMRNTYNELQNYCNAQLA